MQTDPAKFVANLQQHLGTSYGQALVSALAPIYGSAAETAKELSQGDPKLKDVWDKYSEEIDSLASSPSISPALRTNKRFWDKTAELVRSNHFDDFVAAKASEMQASLAGTSLEGGSGGVRGSPADDANADSWKLIEGNDYGRMLIERYGRAGVRENATKLGIPLDRYAKMVSETNVVRDPRGWTYNRDIMRDVRKDG
jgi:hypothetical protein